MEYKSQPEWQSDTKQLSKLPGLANDGSNCYANAMLQVLIHTPHVYNHFEKYSCHCGNNCVYCLMKETFFSQVKALRRTIDPVPFLTQIFENNTHGLILGIQDCPAVFYALLEDLMEDNEEESISKNILKDIFHCQQVEITQCKRCSNKIENVDNCIHPFFPISSGNIVDSLAKHFELERTCIKCEAVTQTTERKLIVTPPPILFFKLEEELLLDIDFTETLDISPYLAKQNGKPVMYELSSVVVYVKRRAYRHYYSFCKAPNGQWNKYDDTKVMGGVSVNNVLEVKPYLLFYKRIHRPDENVIADKENKKSKILKRKVNVGNGNKKLSKKQKLCYEHAGSNENVECRTKTLTISPHPEKTTSAERIECNTSVSTGG